MTIIHRHTTQEDKDDLRVILRQARPADIAAALVQLEEDERSSVFELLDDETAGAVLDEMEEIPRDELIGKLDSEHLSDIVEAMHPDEAVDLLEDLSEERIEEILGLMEDEKAEEMRQLLQYPEESAGGIMTPELISVQAEMSTSQAIDHLRKWADAESIFYVYVVDTEERLLGTVPLRRLVTTDPETPMVQIIDPDAITVDVNADQEEIARIFERYDLPAVPVVDEQKRLLGRITLDDIVNVIEEEATEDVYKMAGTHQKERRSRSAFGVAKARLPWLFTCLLGTLISGAVIKFFNATLSQAIALAVFIPAIMAMGGNIGIQTSTIVVRGLVTGHLDLGHVFRYMLKEVSTALIIGSIFGTLVGLIAKVWMGTGIIGFVVGTAMLLAILISAALGVLIPLIFRRLGIDPAVASGPLITTTNDVIALLVYLGLATALMKYFPLG